MDPKQQEQNAQQPASPEVKKDQGTSPSQPTPQATPAESFSTTLKSNSSSSSTPPPPPHEGGEKRVSLRTIILIVALAILTAVLLFVALKPLQKPASKTSLAPTPTPSQAHSVLSMQLDSTANASQAALPTKSVDVQIDTSANKVEGVQFDISYDPTVLTNVTVTPGTFFPKALVLLNQVDSKNGKIHYALGIQPTDKPQTGVGTVAVISFVMVPTQTGVTTKLSFLPKTQVVQQGTLGSVLEKSTDITIPTASLTPTTKGAIQPTASK